MPKIYQAKNGLWYKSDTEEEKQHKFLITQAIDHSLGKTLPHSIDAIKGYNNLKSELQAIHADISDIRLNLTDNENDLNEVKATHNKIQRLETKLFYNAWFFKNGSYDYLEFDDFQDESKLFYGITQNGKLIPESKKINDYSIYRTIKFIPKIKNHITRYMIHVEYETTTGGLIVEVSFDEGNRYHTVLSTVEDKNTGYYYQYPNFCDCDNNVPELDSSTFIIRFRLLSNAEGAGVSVKSYGIAIA